MNEVFIELTVNGEKVAFNVIHIVYVVEHDGDLHVKLSTGNDVVVDNMTREEFMALSTG